MTRLYACSPFTTVAEVFERGCSCQLENPTHVTLIGTLIDVASDVLARLTGLQVLGRCTATFRPMGNGYCGPSVHPSMYGLDVIPLRGPAAEVMEVMIDGVVLNPSEYGLLDDMYLFRQEGSWPGSNTVRGADTDVGVFTITQRFGNPIDWIAGQAAIDMVCLFAEVLQRNSNELPRGTVSASLQGTTVQIDNLADSVADVTGNMEMVAQFLGVWAPDLGNKGVSGVWSPELDMGWDLVEVDGPSGS